MRLVIDLDTGRDDAATAAALALAQACGAAHDVQIVLDEADGDAVDAVRLAFAALPARVRSYALPGRARGAAHQWRSQAAALIRQQFLATLAPDLVLGADVPASPAYAHAALASATLASVLAVAPRARAIAVAHAHATLANAHATPAASDAGAQAGIDDTSSAAAARPRLAYISPLPPEHSGIADYSAELLPELARFYDIELIVDQPIVDDARLAAWTPRSLAWFDEHAGQFERVLYHFGNSHMHQHMFGMIRRHPGIVVLHDFYLSGILDNIERDGYLPQAFLGGLYEAHGYSGLLDHARLGRNPSIWKYPLNKGVLDNASGVIVHSDYSRRLAEQWYGPGAADRWRVVPLLRGRVPGVERAAARARLGLADDDYLVCSFGMLGQIKLNAELLDAVLASPLADDAHCKLVFVGQNDAGPYGAALEATIAAAGCAAQVSITGFVSPGQYADYLAACDCAVQLRAATRGETSAAIHDCLLYGAPTIINAHGAAADIDDALLVKLPDAVDVATLAAALARLHADPALRAQLGARAAAHLAQAHAPAQVGQLYADAIEQFTRDGAAAHYRRLVDALVRIPAPATASSAELADAAEAIALNQPAHAPRQLLVDVSAVVQSDIKTGIQRVVRSELLALIAAPPPGFRVEPVYSTGGNRAYHYARQFTLGMLGQVGLTLDDAPVDLRPGDVFLGLDLFTNGTAQNAALLARMRARGVAIYFCVYDILPMLRPAMFPFGTEQYFGDFLHTVAAVADGVVCISRAVADELAGWLAREAAPRAAPLQIGWFHLGADIDASAPSFGLPEHAEQVFAAVAARPSFLMVGTVEPRKGHAQTLAAFELLWEQGCDINLLIVGKQGWMVDKLVERMAAHPEKNVRLFWLPGVSDEMLLKLYASVSALLSPSEGEGFGLPLIEAAQHGVPIIARELPVFREVAGEHAYYFTGLEPAALAEAMRAWLDLHAAGKAPPSTALPWLTWADSARQLTAAVVDGQCYRHHPAP